jgi:hypothetical protein
MRKYSISDKSENISSIEKMPGIFIGKKEINVLAA